jgi:hypothetical protein
VSQLPRTRTKHNENSSNSTHETRFTPFPDDLARSSVEMPHDASSPSNSSSGAADAGTILEPAAEACSRDDSLAHPVNAEHMPAPAAADSVAAAAAAAGATAAAGEVGPSSLLSSLRSIHAQQGAASPEVREQQKELEQLIEQAVLEEEEERHQARVRALMQELEAIGLESSTEE